MLVNLKKLRRSRSQYKYPDKKQSSGHQVKATLTVGGIKALIVNPANS
jgi:predicted lipoprotein